MNLTWQHSTLPWKSEEETNMRFKLSNICKWLMDWKRCKYSKWNHLYREMRMQTGRGHFSPAWGKGTHPGAAGWDPCCRRGGTATSGCIRSWTYRDCSAFWGQADLFLTCAWAVSSYGFYSGHWRGGYDFSSLPFCCSPAPRHCQAVSLSIAVLSAVWFPMLAKSNTFPNHPKKQDRWALSLDPPVHCCRSPV